jgi:hypothetical protein
MCVFVCVVVCLCVYVCVYVCLCLFVFVCRPACVCLYMSSLSHESSLRLYISSLLLHMEVIFCLKFEVWKILSSLLLVVAVDGFYFQIPPYHI